MYLLYDPKKLIGWKPAKWSYSNKNDTSIHRGHGRKKGGPAHTKSPASLRRKARSLAARKA